MEEKYLFLDIDGVLNHEEWYEKVHKNPIPFPSSSFDPVCVERVNEILEITNAKLVISSSWRFDNKLTETLKNVGLRYDFEVTPTFRDKHHEAFNCRGEEIKAYLNEHPYKTYVIIDDDSDMLEEQLPYFVQTSAEALPTKLYLENKGTGLTEEVKKKTILILNQ